MIQTVRLLHCVLPACSTGVKGSPCVSKSHVCLSHSCKHLMIVFQSVCILASDFRNMAEEYFVAILTGSLWFLGLLLFPMDHWEMAFTILFVYIEFTLVFIVLRPVRFLLILKVILFNHFVYLSENVKDLSGFLKGSDVWPDKIIPWTWAVIEWWSIALLSTCFVLIVWRSCLFVLLFASSFTDRCYYCSCYSKMCGSLKTSYV